MSRGGADGRLVDEIAALERTALAWERTAVSLAAVGTLLLKLVDAGPAAELGGLLLIALTVVVVLLVVPVGYHRARSRLLGDQAAGADPWRPRALLATACAVSLTAALVGLDGWLEVL